MLEKNIKKKNQKGMGREDRKHSNQCWRGDVYR
jgi:hypothetical protein